MSEVNNSNNNNSEEVIKEKLLVLFSEMFTKEYMETNETIKKKLVSQLTISLESLYEVINNNIYYYY